jgi:hypothetical protein
MASLGRKSERKSVPLQANFRALNWAFTIGEPLERDDFPWSFDMATVRRKWNSCRNLQWKICPECR